MSGQHMNRLTRRELLATAGLAAGAVTAGMRSQTWAVEARPAMGASASGGTSLARQLYDSLSDAQREKVCLPVDHPRRQYVSNWWYIHPQHRIPTTYDTDQQALIKQIFDGLHSEAHQDAVNRQVLLDQYGEQKYAPAAGFFGTPEDEDFEFIFTGHHVTRRCNAHSDQGQGFGGAPIFYGHYPHPEREMRTNFYEAQEHPGNPYWYQGKLFNRFVQVLRPEQQQQGLLSRLEPRSESPQRVIADAPEARGLSCSRLSDEQRQVFLDTMRGMLAMFRDEDVRATMATIEDQQVVDRLQVSWFDGKYDIGSDQVWDTWQIEGPDMVWYFRGEPHIHCYFHLKAKPS